MAITKRAKPRTTQRAATPGKKKSAARAPQPKKVVARPTKRPAARAGRSAKFGATAAAPLLVTAQKKVGMLTAKTEDAVKPSIRHHLKVDPAPIYTEDRSSTAPDFDPLALARPWMRLGVQMAIANFALQARVARTAMDLPPAAALRQGSAAYVAWIALFGPTRPAKT
jgi:hypothetical protein